MRELNRFQGCLLGGAAGDALGYAVEFLSMSAITAQYGRRGITRYELRDGLARISDDTQMTLFTAAGLLCGGEDARAEHIARAYRDWYRTQTERYPLEGGAPCSWLTDIPELFHRRAPGNTCMSALAQGGNGTIENPINQSKGCGGVMRAAPVGLYFAGTDCPFEASDRLGAESAALTHGNEFGYLPAAMLSHIIRRIVESRDTAAAAVNDAIRALRALFPKTRYVRALTSLIKRAVSLAEEDWEDLDAISVLGEGWTAEETLAIAVYCALKYEQAPNGFEKGVIAAVNHNGDSDSTGAVTGNILGAALGVDAIGREFVEDLELKDVILEVAEDLWQMGPRENEDEQWKRKYRGK